MELRKAARSQVKLRIGLSSPSGGGKTYSALQLAYGMVGDWSKIALIDSENGSGDLYSSLGEYNILPITAPYSPERYIQAITACEKAGVEIIIIDSISHEWEGEGGCLQINDQIAQSKFRGNTWSAWSVTGPRHQKFLERINNSSCHIITTVRNKVDTAQVEGKVKKVGTKELTREGFEYELTINFNLERDSHKAMASKDRTGLYIDRDPFLMTPDIGKEIIEWNNSGAKPKPVKKELTNEEKQEKKYNLIVNEIEMSTHEDQINLTLGVLKQDLIENPSMLSKVQVTQIGALKAKKIAEFNKKQSKDTVKKK